MTARRWSVSADEGGDAGTDRMAYSAAALRAVGAGYEPADRGLGGARRGRDVVRDVGLADAGRPSRGEPAWLCGGSVDGRAGVGGATRRECSCAVGRFRSGAQPDGLATAGV